MARDLFTTQPEPSGLYARVALERGVDHPEGLTYSVPKHLEDLAVGERVSAPLGRGDHSVSGYVIEIGHDLKEMGLAGFDPDKIKSLLARSTRSKGQNKGPESNRFPASIVSLAQWVSQYYCCPIGLTLSSMAPSAVKKQTGAAARSEVRLAAAPPDPAGLKSELRDDWSRICALDPAIFPIEPRKLADLLAHRTIASINRLIRAGLLESIQTDFVRSRGAAELSWDQPDLAAGTPSLTSHQRAAVDAIGATLDAFQAHLLFGVTGSGKTEVYLHVLERVIEQGRTAIVLVPEISLTPQTAGRFVARFAHRLGVAGVAVLHSGLSASQRHREWSRVAAGEARIVVGARSAIFAPFDPERGAPLGLIIVDEEHDASYKQDQAPRYHARDVALRRGQLEGCPVLLGSATPSLETWHNATAREQGGAGRFHLHTLPERVAGGRMPTVDVVDLVEERKKQDSADRRLRSIGPTLEHAIRRTLERDAALKPADKGGGKVMLLLNRRGYASYICCPDQGCGWFMTCNHCDVTVVYHKRTIAQSGGGGGRGVVRCHHCLAEQRLPALCPLCSKNVNTFGFGTQRLEDEIASLFPSLVSGETMLRLDSDTMRRASDYFSALDRFRRGEVRLLLGTQMISKGLDFPDVELIGVINADTAINMPDFRAAERTFALVSQVAGRAGRSDASGKRARVIVQTFNPHEPAIQYAAAHDFKGFAQREIGFRREAGLPPVGRMARIVCRDEDAVKAQRHAREVYEALTQVGEKRLRVRPPAPCPISRVAGHHRWAVELMAPTPAPIQNALAAIRATASVRSDTRTAVDVDPVALL